MNYIEKNFLIPKKIKVKKKSKFEYKIILQPLERGFGNTIGYALRRILLSSIPGSAITQIEIKNVLHEYDTIKNVKEDVINIILNIKNIYIKKKIKKDINLYIKKKGICTVYAKDIINQENIKIINKNNVIAHLTHKKASLNIKMKLSYNKGYKLAYEEENSEKNDNIDIISEDIIKNKNKNYNENKDKKNNKIGIIKLDTAFNPIKRVSYKIEKIRIKEKTDLDKLIMIIKTNGTISPKKCIKMAATILQYQLSSFTNFEDETKKTKKKQKKSINPIFIKPVDNLELTVRAANCLKSENIYYIGDLIQRSEQDLLKMPNLGRKSLTEITEVIKKLGLHMSTKIKNWETIRKKFYEKKSKK